MRANASNSPNVKRLFVNLYPALLFRAGFFLCRLFVIAGVDPGSRCYKGCFLIYITTKGDPRQQHSGMTLYLYCRSGTAWPIKLRCHSRSCSRESSADFAVVVIPGVDPGSRAVIRKNNLDKKPGLRIHVRNDGLKTTTGKRETLKQVQGGLCFMNDEVLSKNTSGRHAFCGLIFIDWI